MAFIVANGSRVLTQVAGIEDATGKLVELLSLDGAEKS
jgi:hypothetical protein